MAGNRSLSRKEPRATFDNKGHAFLCYPASRNGIFVRRSLDGGKTWEAEAAALKVFPTGKEPDMLFSRSTDDGGKTLARQAAKFTFAGADSTDQGRIWSTDGGQTFANYSWGQTQFTERPQGDYI